MNKIYEIILNEFENSWRHLYNYLYNKLCIMKNLDPIQLSIRYPILTHPCMTDCYEQKCMYILQSLNENNLNIIYEDII